MVITRNRAASLTPENPMVASGTKRGRPRKRSPSPSSPLPPPPPPPPASSAAIATTPEAGYEKCREERIKENMERMQKLGILDLSLNLKKTFSNPSTNLSPNSKRRITTALSDGVKIKPSLPIRRSSRLQNVTPVSYAEVHVKGNDDLVKNSSVLVEEGMREEVYTEEHEKLLGTCEMTWILFVDGYGKDGRRIYDHIEGKTCHQCRQKTLGRRTHCCICKLVQGQFCGDCLYMRYGENVLEANKNPDWVCPVCRGICNCSLCRIKKGWIPTGPLYKKIVSLGYKSVAHYLIQTRRSLANSGDLNSAEAVSSKKLLSATEAESSPDPQNVLQDGLGKDSNGCKDETQLLQSSDERMSNNAAEEGSIQGRTQSNKAMEPAAPLERSQDCIANRLRKRQNRS
ncbi:uncharacterized protein [Typha angustifolia]|uniref:uncharacterized protein n=1 Tax=Typha angustifolia TaxID=59011 RepID=UPI003C2C0C4E